LRSAHDHGEPLGDEKALSVADGLFASAFTPWCPDGF
jgi:hypothetical protein